MSTKYRKSKDVTTSALYKRLEEFSNVITKDRKKFEDVDVVLMESARRLKVFERMTVLAIKHCPIEHHDYQEILNII